MSFKWGQEMLQTALDELAAVGITPRQVNGGKHKRLFWEHNGEPRTATIPITPSDYRSLKNNRAQIRRLLREDGLLGQDDVDTQDDLPAALAPNLTLENGVVFASSLDVATHFGKSHKDVLRSIDRLLGDLEPMFAERNFAPSSYIDGSGKSNRSFKLTRDALSLLAMGFTGSSALKWKQTYIAAFNKMEAELLRISLPNAVEAKLRSLEADIAALVDLMADFQKNQPKLLPAAEKKPRLKPLPHWMKRQYERRQRRQFAA